MSNMINIAMICDEKFICLTKTCIRSIIANKKNNTLYHFYIIGVEISKQTIQEFQNLEQPNVVITILIKNNDYENIGQLKHRVSKATLFKFQLPALIPTDKVLYLDGDIIASDDLGELYHTDISENYAAMAVDWVAEIRKKDHIRLLHRHYFNSGVILLNLKKMREDSIAEKLLAYKEHDTFNRYMDQDAFNVVLYPKILLLNEKYNFHEEYEKLRLKDTNYAYLQTIDNIVLRHYTAYKPTEDLKFPHSEQFFHYADYSDFVNCIIKTMRDDYARLYQHFVILSSKHEDLVKRVKILEESFWKIQFRKLFIQKANNQYSCLLLGLPLFKKTTRSENKKYYLFGLPIISISTKNNIKTIRIFGIKISRKQTISSLSDTFSIKANDKGIFEISKLSDLPELPKEKLNIGFLLAGGLGDTCLAANYLYYFRQKFNNYNIHIDVYIRNTNPIAKTVFENTNITDRVFTTYKDGKYTDVSCIYKKYDLFIRIVRLPEISHLNAANMTKFPLLQQYTNILQKFRQDYCSLFSSDLNALSYCNLKKINRVQQADINNFLGIRKQFTYTLPINISVIETLKKFNLLNKKFITIHNETDLRYPEGSCKLWKAENFSKLIELIKKQYPDYIFVQIGGDKLRSPEIPGIDFYLTGQTNFEEIKVLLKECLLHIDIEGGFVHLQRAINGSSSCVLFGPTDINFFSYPENINITNNICAGCENIFPNWQNECLNQEKNICMRSITPGAVAQQILSYLNKKELETKDCCKILSLKEAKAKYKTIYFSFNGLGDTLLFRSAIEKLSKQRKQRILIGTKNAELFKDSKCIDILEGIDESTFNALQRQKLLENNIEPIFITGVKYIKDPQLGYRRQWPNGHLLTSLCNKLGIIGKIELAGSLNLNEIEKAYGRFFEKTQIAFISKGLSQYKTIPLPVIQDVIKKLSDKYDFVQLGNAKDPLLDGVLDKRGCPSLREAASILYNSDLFVGGISGLMHLARFVGCPSVIVYSHAEPETLVHYLCNIDIHPKTYTCSECGKGNCFPYQIKCCNNYGCISGITSDEIIAAIEQQLKKRSHFSPLTIGYETTTPARVKGIEEFIKQHGDLK